MLTNLSTFEANYPVLFAWTGTAAVALAASLVALAAYGTAWALVARVTRSLAYSTTVLRSARDAGRIVAVLLALQLVWDNAPGTLPHLAGVERYTTVALTIGLAWLAARAIAGLADAIITAHPLAQADNLGARRVQTQTRVIARTLMGLVLFLGAALALMSFPGVRSIGASLLASAGIAGLVIGFAARPALGNLIAGLQLAVTQPIRLDDVVIVEGEWGRIEEVGTTYVVVRIWDQRRLVVPLQWFLEHPFQNWTRTSADIIGSVFVWTDYRLPIAPVAAELQRLCNDAPEWDRRVCVLQVTDANERAMQLRALVALPTRAGTGIFAAACARA